MKTSPSLDIFSNVAPLGLRFHDVATREPVVDRLKVSVSLPENREEKQKSYAIPNRSGVFVFQYIKGLGNFRSSQADDLFWQKNPPYKTYRIEVEDLDGRFQPIQFSDKLPVKGIYTWEAGTSSPPNKSSISIPLYSAPTRKITGGMSVIRAEMRTVAGLPASWAVLEVRLEGKITARGFADENGKIVLIFPTPAPLYNSIKSPPEASAESSLADQKWVLSISVKYSPAIYLTSPDQFENLKSPDLRLLLAQSTGKIWTDKSQTNELQTVILKANKELILRSSGTGILSPMLDEASANTSFLFVSSAN